MFVFSITDVIIVKLLTKIGHSDLYLVDYIIDNFKTLYITGTTVQQPIMTNIQNHFPQDYGHPDGSKILNFMKSTE